MRYHYTNLTLAADLEMVVRDFWNATGRGAPIYEVYESIMIANDATAGWLSEALSTCEAAGAVKYRSSVGRAYPGEISDEEIDDLEQL